MSPNEWDDLPNESPLPEPLAAPRYQDFFDSKDKSAFETNLLKDNTDEIIFIRARMHCLFQEAMQPGISTSRLTSILNLFSRALRRLARLLAHRQEHYLQRIHNPEHRTDRTMQHLETQQEMQKKIAIRSSKKPQVNLLIENPLSLSPLMREGLKPLLYPETDKIPTPGKPAKDLFVVLQGILHKFLTRTPWYHLPLNYPSYSTCHRYYSIWHRSGLLHTILFILTIQQLNIEIDDMQRHQELLREFFRR